MHKSSFLFSNLMFDFCLIHQGEIIKADIIPWAIDADIEKGRVLPSQCRRFVNVKREAEAVAAVMTTHFAPIEHYTEREREEKTKFSFFCETFSRLTVESLRIERSTQLKPSPLLHTLSIHHSRIIWKKKNKQGREERFYEPGMRARATPTIQMRVVLIRAARKLRVRSPNGWEMDTNRSTDMNVSNRSETYREEYWNSIHSKRGKEKKNLGCRDGQDADDCALPWHHPVMRVLIVLAAETDITLAQAQQVNTYAHVCRCWRRK